MAFCCITPILLIFAVLPMGGGHGTYSVANLLFPWGMVGTIFQDSINGFFTFLGMMQYPIYGLLLDKFKNTNSFEKVILTILLVHLILFLLIVSFSKFD